MDAPRMSVLSTSKKAPAVGSGSGAGCRTIAAGAVAAAAGPVMLVVRCTRTPRADLIAWTIATAGLTIALAAQVLGYQKDFAPITFRAVQLGAQLVAPLALAWGIIEVAARSMPARFAARLLLSA